MGLLYQAPKQVDLKVIPSYHFDYSSDGKDSKYQFPAMATADSPIVSTKPLSLIEGTFGSFSVTVSYLHNADQIQKSLQLKSLHKFT